MIRALLTATLTAVVVVGAPLAADAAKIPVAKSNYEKVALKIAGGKTTYKPGETITIEYKTQDMFAQSGWIGMIPSEIKHGDEDFNDRYDITFKYLNKQVTGTLTFQAPAKKGNWDLRMHNTDSQGKEIAYVSFEVK